MTKDSAHPQGSGHGRELTNAPASSSQRSRATDTTPPPSDIPPPIQTDDVSAQLPLESSREEAPVAELGAPPALASVECTTDRADEAGEESPEEAALAQAYEEYLVAWEQTRATLPTISPRQQAIADELAQGITEEHLLAKAESNAEFLQPDPEKRQGLVDLFTKVVRNRHDSYSNVVPAEVPPISRELYIRGERMRRAQVAIDEAKEEAARAEAKARAAKQAADRHAVTDHARLDHFLQGRDADSIPRWLTGEQLQQRPGDDPLDSYIRRGGLTQTLQQLGLSSLEDAPAALKRQIGRHVQNLVVREPARLSSLVAAALADGTKAYVIEEVLAIDERSLLHGQPRDLKSLMAIELCVAVATGKPAFGSRRFAIRQPGAALYLTAEDRLTLSARRCAAVVRGRGIDPLGTTPVYIQSLQGFSGDRDLADPDIRREFFRKVTAYCKAWGVILVVIDPLRSLAARCVDQGAAAFAPFADSLRQLHHDVELASLCVHHDVKPTSGKPSGGKFARAHLASGTLFSSFEAPIGVQRIDANRVRLIPEAYKDGAIPQAVRIRQIWEGDALRLVVDTRAGRDNGDEHEKARILTALEKHGPLSGRDVAEVLGLQKDLVARLLEEMHEDAEVGSLGQGAAHRWARTSRPEV